MKKLNVKIIISMIGFILLGCNSPDAADCFQTAGDEVNILYQDVPEFNTLIIQDDIELTIIQDELTYFELDYFTNLAPEVSYRLENDSLIFENKNICKFVRNYKVPVLKYHTNQDIIDIIALSTSPIHNRDTIFSDINIVSENISNTISLTINNNRTRLSSNSTTNIELKGSTERLNYNGYFNDAIINCKQLEAKRVDFLQRGYNDLIFNVSDSLVGSIENAGRVLYLGEPGIKVKISGGGQLIKL